MAGLLAMLSACSMSLKQHALVAVAAGDAIDALGAHLQSEADSDYEAAGGDAATPEAIAALHAIYGPLREKYDRARETADAYHKRISEAHSRGDKHLAAVEARKLLDQWRSMQDLGTALGVDVFDPPAVLIKIAGEP